MSLKTFNVDVAIAEALYQLETRENRITRSRLRLSSNWKVLGRTIGLLLRHLPPPGETPRERLDACGLRHFTMESERAICRRR